MCTGTGGVNNVQPTTIFACTFHREREREGVWRTIFFIAEHLHYSHFWAVQTRFAISIGCDGNGHGKREKMTARKAWNIGVLCVIRIYNKNKEFFRIEWESYVLSYVRIWITSDRMPDVPFNLHRCGYVRIVPFWLDSAIYLPVLHWMFLPFLHTHNSPSIVKIV